MKGGDDFACERDKAPRIGGMFMLQHVEAGVSNIALVVKDGVAGGISGINIATTHSRDWLFC